MSTALKSTSTAASTSEGPRTAGEVATGDPRLYPDRPSVAASIAVFRDGKVLVAARTKPPGPDVFSLPGGVVEVGETLEQAALRELDEEVGVRAEIIGFAGHVEVIERDEDGLVRQHFIVNAFAGRWLAGEPQTSLEASQVLFVAPDSLAELATTPGLAGIVQRAWSICKGAA